MTILRYSFRSPSEEKIYFIQNRLFNNCGIICVIIQVSYILYIGGAFGMLHYPQYVCNIIAKKMYVQV